MFRTSENEERLSLAELSQMTLDANNVKKWGKDQTRTSFFHFQLETADKERGGERRGRARRRERRTKLTTQKYKQSKDGRRGDTFIDTQFYMQGVRLEALWCRR